MPQQEQQYQIVSDNLPYSFPKQAGTIQIEQFPPAVPASSPLPVTAFAPLFFGVSACHGRLGVEKNGRFWFSPSVRHAAWAVQAPARVQHGIPLCPPKQEIDIPSSALMLAQMDAHIQSYEPPFPLCPVWMQNAAPPQRRNGRSSAQAEREHGLKKVLPLGIVGKHSL